jgi:hypothetical protein
MDRNRGLRFSLLAPVLTVAATVAVMGGMANVAGAATAPPTPESLTNCGGTLTPDASGASQDEPYLLDYAFNCNTQISAYTITVDRLASGTANVDNYSSSANVVEPDQSISPTESITCEGTTPSNGINCNLGAGGLMDTYAAAEGSIDLVQPYCAYLPPKAKPGTPAVPQAIVSVVVTDNTGAEDGPFYLSPTTACKKVAAVVPTPVTKVTKKKKK